MSYSNYVTLLSGTVDDQKTLLDLLINKAISGQLDETEVIILETVKKILLPKPILGEMSSSLTGRGGVQI